MYLVTTASVTGNYKQCYYVLGLFDTLDECDIAIQSVKDVLKSYNTKKVTKFLKDLDNEWFDEFFKIIEVEPGTTYAIPFEIFYEDYQFKSGDETKYIGSYAE